MGSNLLKNIHINQIVDVDPDVFLEIIAEATKIEDPIRLYAQKSSCYLALFHVKMARFVGEIRDLEGFSVEIGVWEKKERQHEPFFHQIYQQLTG